MKGWKSFGPAGRIHDLLIWVAGGIIVLMMLIISADVGLKFFLNRPQSWVLETSSFSLLIITFLTGAWLLRNDRHIKIDSLVNLLNPRSQALLGIITSAIGMVVCAILTWSSAMVALDFVNRGVRATTFTAPPQAPFIAIIAIGFFTLLIEFLIRGNRSLQEWRTLSSKQQVTLGEQSS